LSIADERLIYDKIRYYDMRITVKVAKCGQVSIPADIRRYLDVREGYLIELEVIGKVNKCGMRDLGSENPHRALIPGLA
jgi:AbrB family looped-hinge helix DNA binding protein